MSTRAHFVVRLLRVLQSACTWLYALRHALSLGIFDLAKWNPALSAFPLIVPPSSTTKRRLPELICRRLIASRSARWSKNALTAFSDVVLLQFRSNSSLARLTPALSLRSCLALRFMASTARCSARLSIMLLSWRSYCAASFCLFLADFADVLWLMPLPLYVAL